MKTYTQLINELKLPTEESGIGIGPMLRRAISPRARRLKKAVKERKSPERRDFLRRKIKDNNAAVRIEKELKAMYDKNQGSKDINTPWTTTTNAAT